MYRQYFRVVFVCCLRMFRGEGCLPKLHLLYAG